MAVPIVMPKLGMVMSEGTVAKWAKAAGETVNRGEIIAEIETEKINYELEATDDGILHHVVDEGASVLVDGVVAYLLAEGEGGSSGPAAARGRARPGGRPASQAFPCRPALRWGRGPLDARRAKLASQLGVELSAVTATGPGGRVVEADVRAHAGRRNRPRRRRYVHCRPDCRRPPGRRRSRASGSRSPTTCAGASPTRPSSPSASKST